MSEVYNALKWAKGFPDIKATCQKCGHKFVFSESGSIGCFRIINSEPPECSVKPKLLTGGET